jgi:hypothetical protein
MERLEDAYLHAMDPLCVVRGSGVGLEVAGYVRV